MCGNYKRVELNYTFFLKKSFITKFHCFAAMQPMSNNISLIDNLIGSSNATSAQPPIQSNPSNVLASLFGNAGITTGNAVVNSTNQPDKGWNFLKLNILLLNYYINIKIQKNTHMYISIYRPSLQIPWQRPWWCSTRQVSKWHLSARSWMKWTLRSPWQLSTTPPAFFPTLFSRRPFLKWVCFGDLLL